METLQKTDVTVEESLPEFPRLPGVLGRVVDAISPDIPYEHKALSVLTYAGLKLSGRARLAPPYGHLQPRFYACLIGPPASGKSAAQQEVSHALRELGGVHVEFSIDSGPALVEALEEYPRLLYMPDELTDAFQKARHGKLFGQWLRLYEANETGRRVVKRNAKPAKLTNVHFAMVATATPEGFRDMWQGTRGGSSGLQSRFVLSYSDELMPEPRTGNNEQALSQAVSELTEVLSAEQPEITISSGANHDDLFWYGLSLTREDLGRFPRLLDMLRRFALLLAACNRATEIDEEMMRLAIAFSKYQEAAYRRLMPADASNQIQAIENRIIAFFQRLSNKEPDSDGQPRDRATFRETRNHIKPEYSPGGFKCFNQAFDSLTRAGKLKEVGKNRVGKELWKLDD